MKRLSVIFFALLALAACAQTPQKELEITWSRVLMDGSRTGVTTPFYDFQYKAIGSFNEDGMYLSPKGVLYPAGSTVANAASVLIDAQEVVRPQKVSVGTCPGGMTKKRPELALAYWSADAMQYGAEKLYDTKVDVVFLNLGGIRENMPNGNVMREDIMSMFPFKNAIILYQMTGETLMKEFRRLMEGKFQPVGGVTLVLDDGNNVLDALVGGEKIEAEKVYTVLGNSFIDNGGDGFFLNDLCLSKEVHSEHILFDLIIRYVEDTTAAGKPIALEKKDRFIRK